jgi:hypothetical protein
MAFGATPDPALIIALKKIPHYYGTPLAALLISVDAALWAHWHADVRSIGAR